MKKLLQKKISIFIFTAMLFSASANAQIVYTDIAPDLSYTITNLSSQTYNLDLDGDGTTDFVIRAARANFTPLSLTLSYVGVTPQGSSAVVTTTSNTVKKVFLGDTISSSQAWHDSTLQYLKRYQQSGSSTPTNTGEWDSVVDGYVGLQLINGSQIYYGWVRMDVTVSMSSASMTIKDYAYNTIPNQLILAGQTIATGVNENSFASSINIFPNPATDKLTIALGSNNEKVEVTIADITGKIIYKTVATNPDSYRDEKIELNTNDFAAGIYVVQIQTAEFTATKKLVVEK